MYFNFQKTLVTVSFSVVDEECFDEDATEAGDEEGGGGEEGEGKEGGDHPDFDLHLSEKI